MVSHAVMLLREMNDAGRVTTREDRPGRHREWAARVTAVSRQPSVTDRVTERRSENQKRINPADTKESARTIKAIPKQVEGDVIVELRRADECLRPEGERCKVGGDCDVGYRRILEHPEIRFRVNHRHGDRLRNEARASGNDDLRRDIATAK